MHISTLLKDYGMYNHWANKRIVDWFRSKPLELMDREVPSSFPSLKLTMLHVWGAEDIWLQRLQGISPSQFLSTNFNGTVETVFEGLVRNSATFRDFLARQSSEFFEETCSYIHTNGNPYTQFHAEIIQHCLQHSTYHRGQMVTIAHNLGLTDPPTTDFIVYVRSKMNVQY